MKTLIRIATAQFEFIEQEFDRPLTPEEAVDAYTALQKAYKGGDGLSKKEFDALIDSYLRDGHMVADDYARCNAEQVNVVQLIKRSIARINYGSKTDIN